MLPSQKKTTEEQKYSNKRLEKIIEPINKQCK